MSTRPLLSAVDVTTSRTRLLGQQSGPPGLVLCGHQPSASLPLVPTVAVIVGRFDRSPVRVKRVRHHAVRGATMSDRRNTRTRKAERIAGQAWEHLVSTVDDAGSAARSATRSARRRAKHSADDVSGRVSLVRSEARRRANLAYDALAGRQPSRP